MDMEALSDEQISHNSFRPLVPLADGLVQLIGGTAPLYPSTAVLFPAAALETLLSVSLQ